MGRIEVLWTLSDKREELRTLMVEDYLCESPFCTVSRWLLLEFGGGGAYFLFVEKTSEESEDSRRVCDSVS